MKQFILLLICVPIIGFSQHCNYGSTVDAADLCDFYRGSNFSTYRNADIALDKILNVTGMSKRFVLKECNDISNCLATTYKGVRYILYDRDFMDEIATKTNSWSNLSILAHEIGHHVNGHVLGSEYPSLAESRQMELEADEYSGFVMYKLGASIYEAQEAMMLLSTNADDSYSTHPSRDKRLKAIVKGYNRAKRQGSNNNEYNPPVNLTAEDYFYKAYNNESDFQYQIDMYTKCLQIDPDYYPSIVYSNRGSAYDDLGQYYNAIDDYTRAIKIDPDNAVAYNNRGFAYRNLERYYDAIDDYTRAIRIDPDYINAYNNRGFVYGKLKQYNKAIDDYTMVIRVDPDYSDGYRNRGITKETLGQNPCNDYKKACDLGDNDCCEWYRDECKYNDYNYDDDYDYDDYDYDYDDDYVPQSTDYEDYIPQSENFPFDNTLTAKDYFYKAYNNKSSDFQYQIDMYTKCLQIDPDYYPEIVYYNRGIAYRNLERYYNAIDDYTRAISIDPDYVDAYNNRGIAYSKLKRYNKAMDDYTMAIRIDPDYFSAYRNRGICKEKLGQYPCNDYKKACNLGDNDCCEWYNECK